MSETTPTEPVELPDADPGTEPKPEPDTGDYPHPSGPEHDDTEPKGDPPAERRYGE